MPCRRPSTVAVLFAALACSSFPGFPATLALAAEEDNAAAWGRENIAAGKYAEAETLLREALPKLAAGSPQRRDAAFALIEALRIQGKLKDADAVCDALLKAKPDDSAAALVKAELDCEIGSYKEARTAYDRVIAVEPSNQRAWALRSIVLRILGDRQALKQTADHFFDLYGSRKSYFNSDEVKDPLELAYLGLGFQDEDPRSAFETAYLLAEDLVKARKADTPEVYLWSGRLLHEKYQFYEGRLPGADTRYRAVLQLRPGLPDALAGRAAIVLQTMHKLDDVEKLLKEALIVNPGHVESHVLYAALCLEEDHFDEARRHIDAALAVNPNHLHALALLAFYHLDLAQPEKAAAAEKRALAVNPHCADFYCDIGELLETKRGFNAAPAYYQKAIDCDPQYWRGYYGLGMSTSRQGAQGEEQGKVLLNKALNKNKFNLWAKNMLVALDSIVGARPELGDPGSQAPAYREARTKHFTLKCYGKEAGIVLPYLEEWAEAAYERQRKLFRFEPRGPLTIELCHTFDIQGARTVGLPNLGALGVCFGRLCTVVSPQESKNKNHPPFNWRKVLEHEFGHVMVLQMTDFRVPRWYTEGFSTWLEDDSRIQSDRMMVDAIAKGRLKPLDRINEYFRTNPLMAYVHGRAIIEYVTRTFGFDAHLEALKLLAQGKKLAEVLPQVTGKSLQELDAGQLAFLKEEFKNVSLRPSYDQAALVQLEVAAGKDDATAQAISDLAAARYGLRRYGDAAALAQKALAKDPKCVDAIVLLGQLAYDKKDYEAAKQRFEEATSTDAGRSFLAWRLLGAIYKKEGRTAKAIAAFECARKLYPRYVGPDNPHHELPDLYADNYPPQWDKALAVWRDCIRVNPEDADAALKALRLAIRVKDFAMARLFACACIEDDPYNPEVHHLAGQAAIELKDWASAAREFSVATVLNDKDAQAWVALARAQMALGDLPAARQAVRQALDVDATDKEAKALRDELK